MPTSIRWGEDFRGSDSVWLPSCRKNSPRQGWIEKCCKLRRTQPQLLTATERTASLNSVKVVRAHSKSCRTFFSLAFRTFNFSLEYVKRFYGVKFFGITSFLVEDLERHDGSEEKPYFMTSSLKKIMNVRNKNGWMVCVWLDLDYHFAVGWLSKDFLTWTSGYLTCSWIFLGVV